MAKQLKKHTKKEKEHSIPYGHSEPHKTQLGWRGSCSLTLLFSVPSFLSSSSSARNLWNRDQGRSSPVALQEPPTFEADSGCSHDTDSKTHMAFWFVVIVFTSREKKRILLYSTDHHPKWKRNVKTQCNYKRSTTNKMIKNPIRRKTRSTCNYTEASFKERTPILPPTSGNRPLTATWHHEGPENQ